MCIFLSMNHLIVVIVCASMSLTLFERVLNKLQNTWKSIRNKYDLLYALASTMRLHDDMHWHIQCDSMMLIQ